MAAKLENESLQERKARLIELNNLQRRHLLDEAKNFRETAGWLEQGYSLLQATGMVRTWIAPPSRKQKRSPVAKILRGCFVGIRIWRNLGR